MRWVVDLAEIVHIKHCDTTIPPVIDYNPAVKSIEDMVDHLVRPDRANGHDGKSPLVPCNQCILDLPLDQS